MFGTWSTKSIEDGRRRRHACQVFCSPRNRVDWMGCNTF